MSTLSLLAAITIAAQPAPDHLRVARSSAEEMARFAAARVCLPVLRGEAGGLQDAVGKSGFAWKRVPGSFALVGTTPNHVQMTPRGGCYFRMDRGDGEKLRLAVLGALTAAGAGPLAENAFDSGPGSRDSAGPYRQERYCLDGQAKRLPLAIVISTGARPHPALQMTLLAANDAPCKRP